MWGERFASGYVRDHFGAGGSSHCRGVCCIGYSPPVYLSLYTTGTPPHNRNLPPKKLTPQSKMIQWRPKLRIPMLSVAAVVSVLSLACWCLLFWFPSAYCENNSNPCGDESKSFLGDDHGPHAGWGLYIAAFVLSVITLIVASTSGSPDSPILYTSLQ